MTIHIRIAQSSDAKQWDQYVLHHPDGIGYQLFAWKNAVRTAYGFKAVYLMAIRSNRVAGVLPLIHIRPPFLPGRLVSLPYCDAGGPLADSESVEKELMNKAIEIARKRKIGKLSIRSIQPFAGIDTTGSVKPDKVRMLLKLSERSDRLLASFKSKLRSQIKKPIRDGLTVKIGSVELLDDFYPLFAENMHTLGSPVHSANWIRSILHHFNNRAHLVLVRMPDKKPAAGGVLLCHPNQVSVPWASSLRSLNRWNPNMLLYWSFLKYACDMGYPMFDFGRSTPGEGTHRFKKQWNTKSAPLFWNAFSTDLQKRRNAFSFRNAAFLKLDEYWKKLPVSLTKQMGPTFRKYIDL